MNLVLKWMDERTKLKKLSSSEEFTTLYRKEIAAIISIIAKILGHFLDSSTLKVDQKTLSIHNIVNLKIQILQYLDQRQATKKTIKPKIIPYIKKIF